jgi:hypothetical protein
MTRLSLSLIAASAVLTAVSLGNTPALADVPDRDTENRGGMLGGAQNPTITKKGSFVHRGKAIVWVPNEARESDPPQRRESNKTGEVYAREVGEAQPRVRATTSGGTFLQNGKVTSWISNEDLAGASPKRLADRKTVQPERKSGLTRRCRGASGPSHKPVRQLCHRTGTLTQPPTVTKGRRLYP